MFHSWKMAIGLLSLVAVLLTVGCQTQTPPATTISSSETSHDEHPAEAADPKVSATLAKLSSEDRQIVEAQKFCAVMNQKKLGSMGTPLKLEIKGEPVFLCCAGCKPRALKNPDETLTKVAALKAGNKAAQ
ncbi:MAG: hypothetical protein NTZ32_20260 [Planctomycetales bacterium]|nr:hypothetical protein [Planctomycetales bacterium]